MGHRRIKLAVAAVVALWSCAGYGQQTWQRGHLSYICNSGQPQGFNVTVRSAHRGTEDLRLRSAGLCAGEVLGGIEVSQQGQFVCHVVR